MKEAIEFVKKSMTDAGVKMDANNLHSLAATITAEIAAETAAEVAAEAISETTMTSK